eukprot:737947-Hanusia_phi.AAC.2
MLARRGKQKPQDSDQFPALVCSHHLNVAVQENAVREAKQAFEDLKRKAGGGGGGGEVRESGIHVRLTSEQENDEAPEEDEKVRAGAEAEERGRRRKSSEPSDLQIGKLKDEATRIHHQVLEVTRRGGGMGRIAERRRKKEEGEEGGGREEGGGGGS